MTMCTFERAPFFGDAEIGQRVREQLLSTAARSDVEVLAFCFMPDHLHALVEGRTEQADCQKCAGRFRRQSAFYFRRDGHARLWQDGYFDRVLRHEEATLDVVRYVLLNPVRAGLCADASDYPLLGSTRYRVGELMIASTLG
jgi:putative transposase